MRVGIIGGMGWIGAALGRAMINTGRLQAAELAILTRSGHPGNFFGHEVSWAIDVPDLVRRCDVIVISVRPQDWPGLHLQAEGKLVISVMAGVPLTALPPRTIRALPNAAAELGQSFTPWLASATCSDQDRSWAQDILSSIGTCAELDSEHQIDLMTATVGAGPAYLALMARALIGFLEAEGMEKTLAEKAADGMICGAAPLLTGKMAAVDSTLRTFLAYNGTTAAGLKAAMAEGFETALNAGFSAGVDRARVMGRTA